MIPEVGSRGGSHFDWDKKPRAAANKSRHVGETPTGHVCHRSWLCRPELFPTQNPHVCNMVRHATPYPTHQQVESIIQRQLQRRPEKPTGRLQPRGLVRSPRKVPTHQSSCEVVQLPAVIYPRRLLALTNLDGKKRNESLFWRSEGRHSHTGRSRLLGMERIVIQLQRSPSVSYSARVERAAPGG
ncbi:hypothetical protein EYF80_035830 [Liparis tanakae]|uniref:Uncharacterized protein n=1 Tax=Liparis tanakae TaxID=230148 RepID=A0A4Z2GMQ0_9TELE|nr:hypothetical protein EYF80_035830 [Liparis tanakae]